MASAWCRRWPPRSSASEDVHRSRPDGGAPPRLRPARGRGIGSGLMQFRGGMNELVRQAARMQRKIDDVKKGIKDKEVSAGAAGDKVTVVVTCEGKLRSIKIDPE